MSQAVTIELADETVGIVREVARQTGRDLEGVLREWIERSAADLPVENLPDDQVLELSEMMLPDAEQEELSDLLYDQREGLLDATKRIRLDELLQRYRRGMVRKAQALRVAVQRGLREPLG